jgi:hypothetical protein
MIFSLLLRCPLGAACPLRARWLRVRACLPGAGLLGIGEELVHARRYLLVAFAGGVQVDEHGAGLSGPFVPSIL